MTRIPLHEAQRRLLELLTEGARGEEIVITGGDGAAYRVAVARVPGAGGPRQADLYAGLIEVAADFDEELPEAFWLGDP